MDAFLKFLRRMAGWLGDWFDLPDLDDEQQVRNCAREVAASIKTLAKYSRPKWDDKFAGSLADLIENDMVWALIYGLLKKLGPDEPLVIGLDDPVVVAAAKQYGSVVEDIRSLIIAIVEILQKLGLLGD